MYVASSGADMSSREEEVLQDVIYSLCEGTEEMSMKTWCRFPQDWVIIQEFYRVRQNGWAGLCRAGLDTFLERITSRALWALYLSIYRSIDSLARRPNHNLTDVGSPVSNPL